MELSPCVGCRAPVLELQGQFDKLDSYFIDDGVPPRESAGWWHLSCLRASDVGPAWQSARLRNYRDVRKFAVVAETPGFVVLEQPRGKRIAIGATGELVELSIVGRPRLRENESGVVFGVSEFQIAPVAAFEPDVDHPLSALLGALDIADRVVDPIALEGAIFRVDDSKRGAEIFYGVLIPHVLLQ